MHSAGLRGTRSLGHQHPLHCFPAGTKMKLACILFCSILIQILMSNNNISSLLHACVCPDCFASILPNPNSPPSRSSQLGLRQGFRPQRGCLILHPPATGLPEVKEAIPLTPPASQVHSHPFLLCSEVPGPPGSVPSVGTCHIILPQVEA